MLDADADRQRRASCAIVWGIATHFSSTSRTDQRHSSLSTHTDTSLVPQHQLTATAENLEALRRHPSDAHSS